MEYGKAVAQASEYPSRSDGDGDGCDINAVFFDVTDGLDICPMDDFQTQFYKKRVQYQTEYSAAFYDKGSPNQRAGTVSIGDLSDPQYFDFISFVQYGVINDQINKDRRVFEETVGVFGDEGNFTTQLVVRDLQYNDRTTVIKEHAKRVGDSVLDYLMSQNSGIKISNRPDFDDVEKSLRNLQETLVSQGFAASAKVETGIKPAKPDPAKGMSEQPFDVRGDRSISVTLERPVNLWSQQALRTAGYSLLNNFEVKAVRSFLRRCNIECRVESRYNSLGVTHTFYLDGYTAPLPGGGGQTPAF
eukprot:CAMPEP_0170183088 /NCGR_PEP_ID=MMETSP0040_2-20121228/29585_1 /TAXON_ID=641309 /ORGANISM="Lotharella oceanica, Strain CCMP622" /LENGTH=301 /DNA_ID=CAMNT_0010428709 /DNA_START=158 /DNA_END=1064 /DNA_ORIENTATION=+